MDVPEENFIAMKRHNMEGVERDGGKVGYMTELVELRFMSVRIRRSQFFHKSCSLDSPPHWTKQSVPWLTRFCIAHSGALLLSSKGRRSEDYFFGIL